MSKEIKQIKKELLHSKRKTAVQDRDDFDSFINEYKDFLNEAKIEREAVCKLKTEAQKSGFSEFNKNQTYKPKDKVFHINRSKNIILTVIGKKPINCGLNIIVAHMDSPRLDLKPNPIFESDGLAYFKTHYYGGIKKYQWASIPLSLHGVISKENGEKINLNLGDNNGDPVFCVNDLLPHLAAEQMKRTSKDLIKGEELNALIGSELYGDIKDEKSGLVKLNILNMLHKQYGVNERDFLSAELSLTPAIPAQDSGIDRSFVASYGQDDKACVFAAAKAIMNIENVDKTTMVVLVDKEETGSNGNTGMKSKFFEYYIEDLCEIFKANKREVLTNSGCISADVTAAYDPNYPDVVEKNNSAFCAGGVGICKYTGSGGKSSTSDASSEFLNKVTRMFDRNKIAWQLCELGKVDLGGGGTIAMFLANLNVDVLDVGVPVLAMHSPYELVNKKDIYEAYKAYSAFLKNN